MTSKAKRSIKAIEVNRSSIKVNRSRLKLLLKRSKSIKASKNVNLRLTSIGYDWLRLTTIGFD